MQLPLTDPDTLFEELVQALPPETVQLARAFKAFVRAKKVKTPAQLLRVVFLYCGLDKSLREVAGTFTVLYESMTDQAVAERLRACGPWVKARLRRRLPLCAVESLPTGRRFVVIDASSIQAPGATGTDYRIHIAMDLVSLQFLGVFVSDVHTGETLTHFTWAPGDVAVADRGYAHCQGMSAAVQQGADLIVRLKPFSVVLGDAAGAPVELSATLKRPRIDTRRTLAVELCATGGQHAVRGWVHAYRLNAEQANRARHKGRQGHQKGTPSATSLLFSRLGVGFSHARTRGALPPDDHGAVPGSLASGNRDKTLEERARGGRVAGESAPASGGGVAPWEMALCVDAGAAYAAAAGGQLGLAGSRACRHVGAPLGHAQSRAGTEDYRRLVLEGGRLGGRLEDVDGTASPEAIPTAASRSARPTLSLRCQPTRGGANGSITAGYPGELMLILAQMTPTPPPTPQGTLCSGVDQAYTLPQGFGSPYNFFVNPAQRVIDAYCTPGVGSTATGWFSKPSSIQFHYTYMTSYQWEPFIKQWQPKTITCHGEVLNNTWCTTSAQVSLDARYPFFIGYTCSYVNNTWRCGCRDGMCATSFWQLQRF
jgi:hypothetical protein